jgi:hypothetical protein
MHNKIFEGLKINQWTVLSQWGMKNRHMYYNVQCKCGEIVVKDPSSIKKQKQCYKCSRKQQTLEGGPRRTHGACSSTSNMFKTYQARYYMIKRCQGKTFKNKKNYYDRKIKVCDRWLESFENFFEDMGQKPENTSLDRIDNSKGYYKENCRWATTKQQNDNKTGCIFYEYNGEKLTIARWAEKWGITRSKANEWLKREGIEFCVNNIEKIKNFNKFTTNEEYKRLGIQERKGLGNRDHAASRNKYHPNYKIYKTWDYMKKNKHLICDDWKNFNKFCEDMGPKKDGQKFIRKDLNKGYNKENCYWG